LPYYDRTAWHAGSDDFPADPSTEAGGTHIGLFLSWVIMCNLESLELKSYSQEGLQKIRSRQITGREFLVKYCDEKFSESNLNEEGNRLAKFYYATNLYFEDYEATLAKDLAIIYEVADSWSSFDKIAPILDQRLLAWKKSSSSKKWKIWR